MKEMKQHFHDSLLELRSMKTLVTTSMMIAVAVVLGFYTVQATEYLKLGFSFIANELTAMMFGPVVGGLMAGLADLIKYLIRPTGPFFAGFTISAIAGGVIYGVILYRRPLNFKRVLIAKGIVSLVVNLFMNTYWLTLLYGVPFFGVLPARALKELIMFPIETILFYMVARTLIKAKIFAELRVKA